MSLDATISGPAADSYVTTSVACTLASSLGLPAWTNLDGSVQEAALRRATREIDSHRFHHGTKRDAAQALSFPRFIDVDASGAAFIPTAVKTAQVLQAEWIAVGGEPERRQWDGPKVSPLGTSSPLCPAALQVLAKYISRTGEYADGALPIPWWRRLGGPWPF